MTNRAQRRAAQQAKIAAMSLPQRVATVLGAMVATCVLSLLLTFVISGETRATTAVGAALGVGIVLAHQYLWVPRRSRRPEH